jgi:hypothetical protein
MGYGTVCDGKCVKIGSDIVGEDMAIRPKETTMPLVGWDNDAIPRTYCYDVVHRTMKRGRQPLR